MPPKKYYAVMKGRKTGIFTSWAECESQIKGFSGAIYKSFKTRQEAQSALDAGDRVFFQSFKGKTEKLAEAPKKILFQTEIIQPSICVDASCLGNPGDVEYRGVDTKTGGVFFHRGPMSRGTNNLGEFLAIVDGLIYLNERDSHIPIYSDSRTAMLWVKNRKVRTQLERGRDNQEIFNLVDRALAWLQNNKYANPILKWDTVSWGEIPADFGRK